MKKKYIFLLIYLAVAGTLYLTSATLAKYITTTNNTQSFNVGSKLYFDYERGDLFRGDDLIIGEDRTYIDDDGNVHQRLETKNVAPGEQLKFHFTVSNFNKETSEVNGIAGQFFPQAGGILELPTLGTTHDIRCHIFYRKLPTDGSSSSAPFTDVTSDTKFVLPVYDEADPSTHVLYEFQIQVILDGQASGTTSDDYFDAELIIYLFVDAASDIE